MPSTRTIQQTVNFASTHVELLPLVGVGGYSNEPAISIANDVLAEILSPPYNWKWNRKTMNLFVPQQNLQDLTFGGAVAFTLASASQLGGVGIALKTASGITTTGFPGTVTVNTNEPHNFAVGDTVYLTGVADSVYNSTENITTSTSSWSGGYVITAVPTTKSFTFASISGQTLTSGAPGISDFGWAEFATMVNEQEDSSPRWVRYLMSARELEPCSHIAIPSKISLFDNQDTTLKVRLWELAGAAPWGITTVYQAKAPLLTSLSSTWSPIPDEYAWLTNEIFVAKAYQYLGKYNQEQVDQIVAAACLKAMGRDDAEGSAEYVVPESPLMGWYWQ